MVVYLAGQTANRPGIGQLTIEADGSYEYIPHPNFNGVVPAATYAISDGRGGVATAELRITVTSVNENPMLNPDVGSTPENTVLHGNVLTNDTDGDGDILTVTHFVVLGITYAAGVTATVVGKGTLVINANGDYTFTPYPYYEGPFPVATYTAIDGEGGTGSTTLTITVTHVNHAPQDGDESLLVDQDTPLVFAAPGLLTNATDLDNDTLIVASFTVAGQAGPFVIGTDYVIPVVGTINIAADGAVSFTPETGFVGVIPTITYVVSDGQGGTDASMLTLTMVPMAADAAPVTPDVPPPPGAPTVWPRGILVNPTDHIGTLDLMSAGVFAWIEPDPTLRWLRIHCWGAAGGSGPAGGAKGGTGGYTVMYINNPLLTLGGRYLRSMVGLAGPASQGAAGAITTSAAPDFGYGGGGAGAGDVDSLPTPCSGGGASGLFRGPDAPTGPDDWARLIIVAGGGGGAGGDFNSASVMAGAGNGGGVKTANSQGDGYPVHPENVLNGRSYGGGGGGYRGGAAAFRTAPNGGMSGTGGDGHGDPTYGQSIAVFASAAGATDPPNPYSIVQRGNGGTIRPGKGYDGQIYIEHN